MSDAAAEALRARAGVGAAAEGDLLRLRATGADRVQFLHRLVSCDVKGIPAGGTAPGLLLTAKGKVVADFLLGVLHDRVEIRTRAAALLPALARFVLADDCALEDRSGDSAALSLIGPRAEEAAARVLGAPLPGAAVAEVGALLLWRGRRAGLPEVRIEGAPSDLAPFRAAAPPLGAEALELLRIEAGEPRLGAEFGEETLPQEAGIEGLVSFTKGCFLGQEPVARLQNRGHTNRGLAGLLLEPGAPVPGRGAAVLDGGKEVGAVTSACDSPALGRPIALALLRHESAAPGRELRVGGVSCAISALPFVP